MPLPKHPYYGTEIKIIKRGLKLSVNLVSGEEKKKKKKITESESILSRNNRLRQPEELAMEYVINWLNHCATPNRKKFSLFWENDLKIKGIFANIAIFWKSRQILGNSSKLKNVISFRDILHTDTIFRIKLEKKKSLDGSK